MGVACCPGEEGVALAPTPRSMSVPTFGLCPAAAAGGGGGGGRNGLLGLELSPLAGEDCDWTGACWGTG